MKVAGGVGLLVLMIAAGLLAGAASPSERLPSAPAASATSPACATTVSGLVASGFTGNFMLDERTATPPALLYLSLTQSGTAVSGYGIIVEAGSQGTTTSGTFPVQGTTDGTSLTLTIGGSSAAPTVLTGHRVACGLELTTAGSSGEIAIWTFVPITPARFNQIVAAWQQQLAATYRRQLAAQATATAQAVASQATQEAHAAAIQATASAQAAAIQATGAAIQETTEARTAAMQATADAQQATVNAQATAQQATVDAYATAAQATQEALAQQQTTVQNANATLASLLAKLASDAQTLVPPPNFDDVRKAYEHDWAKMQTDDQKMRTDAAGPLTCDQLATVQDDLATLQDDWASISDDDASLRDAMDGLTTGNSDVNATSQDIKDLQAALRTLETAAATNTTGTPAPEFTRAEVDQAINSAQQKITTWTGAVATIQAQASDYDRKAADLLKQDETFVAGLSCSG